MISWLESIEPTLADHAIAHRLAQLCSTLRQGKQAQSVSADDQHKKMLALVQKYSDFSGIDGTSMNGVVADGPSAGRTIVGLHLEVVKCPVDSVLDRY